MKVGDLVSIAAWGSVGQVGSRPLGVVTCLDPEEIGDPDEAEVLWVNSWRGHSNHSTWYLEVISKVGQKVSG